MDDVGASGNTGTPGHLTAPQRQPTCMTYSENGRATRPPVNTREEGTVLRKVTRRRRRTAHRRALLVTGLLLATACASRLPTEEHLAANGGGAGSGADGGSAGAGAAASGAGTGLGATGDATGAATGAGSGSQAGPAGGTSGVATGTDPGAAGGGSEGGGDTTPIVIGSVGNYSGVTGSAVNGGPAAVRVWVNAVNEAGGLAGHPVEYIVVDDASDPARHRAAVQDLVENRGVLAFVGVFAPQTGNAAREYLESVGVPAIGGTAPPFGVSPIFFPNASSNESVVFGAMSTAVRFSSGRRLATLTCVEADVCADYKRFSAQLAAEAGLEVVYQADISIAQPDFTAECINARGQGADLIMPVGDQNTIRRVLESCNRQGFRPTLIDVLPDERQAEDPLFDGAVTGTQYFPFVGVEGDAATAEYIGGFDAFAPDEPLNTLTASGWSAAKLFERAFLAGIGAGVPTREGLLAGLYSLQGETVNGLTVPVSFTPGNPPTVAPCWYTLVLTGGRWTTPDGIAPGCR